MPKRVEKLILMYLEAEGIETKEDVNRWFNFLVYLFF